MRSFSTLIVSAALGCGLLLGAAPARALDWEDYWVKQVGLEQKHPQVRVSFDLQKDTWNAVTDDEVVFKFEWHVKLQKTHALSPGSYFEMTVDNATWKKPLQSNVSFTEHFTDTFEVRKRGDQLKKIKENALYVCGQIRNNHGKPNKNHVLTHYIQGSGYLDVSTVAIAGYNVIEKDFPVWVTYDVVCMANPKWHEPFTPAENNFTADKGDFKVQSIDVFLTTFQGQETDPTPGTSCKKLKVTVRIETNKAGIVAYKLWRQPGEAVEKSHMASMKKDGQFKGRFIVEDTFVDTFDKTTYIQYMAEVTNRTFGPSTQWKPITIQCNGGFTTGQPQGAGDLIPSFKVTSTDLKIISLQSKGCPTKAFVTATFIANKPGTFKYFIGTSLNKNKSGQLEAKKVGNVYRAQETLTVDITKSGKLTAHARPVDFPAAGTATSKAYNCTGVDPVGGVTTQ
jgi:hypothetical protein